LIWRIEFDDKAKKDLAALDRTAAKRIITFLRERVLGLDEACSIGQALKGSSLGAFWRYRVGDYRIVASIEDDALRILVVRIGNRKEVYRK